MALLARATESQQSEWRPVFEGVWRWRLAKPEIKEDLTYGGYKAHFRLSLTADEQKRLTAEHGEPDDDVKQSWGVTYRTGLSLGWFDKNGKYNTTRLVDFLAAVYGAENGKKLRKWIEAGNGPPRPADPNDQKAELDSIEEWLGWWEDLEVYGTITQSTDKNGRVWANFGGPLPIGSLPGQPEPDYQAICRGKLRAMVTETDQAQELVSKPAAVVMAEKVPSKADRYSEIFGEDEPVGGAPTRTPVPTRPTIADGSEDRPF
jgi:hypothetical protein